MSDEPWKKSSDDELGSLAQSARRTSLRQARIILIVIGILEIVGAVALHFMLEDEIAKARMNRAVVNESVVQTARLIVYGVAGLGVFFIILGIIVPVAPVACTVTGLVVYLALNAIAAVMDPENIHRGIIIRVLFIVGLVKAVQAAAAYQREVRAERAAAHEDYDHGFER